MAVSMSQPREPRGFPTYVDSVQTPVFDVHTSETFHPHNVCDGGPQAVETLDASPANSCSSSPPSTPSFFQGADRRGSYSCVKEDDCGTAQSFVVSKLSALHLASVKETPQSPKATGQPDMQAPTICCSCGGVQGWQYTHSVGKRRSKSYVDLRLLGAQQDWEWAKRPRLDKTITARIEGPLVHEPGESPLERLPTEILEHIISQLVLDLPPNGYTPRNTDLLSCLQTSRTLKTHTTIVLNRYITIPHSTIFSKFLGHLERSPSLGAVVRRIDLSHFTSVGLGRTKQMNSEIQNLTAKTLLKCLELTPQIQEFLVQENLDDDIDEAVLRKLLCDLPNLRALDFCASSSARFTQAFAAVVSPVNGALPTALALKRISLHECATLPAESLETLLPRLPLLTHLDLGRTRVTDSALASIPKDARLTHLNLSKCTQISGQGVVNFLTTHPAVKDTLVYLNLFCDTTRYRLLQQTNVEALLPKLPGSLRSLSLSGAKIAAAHIPLLLRLTKHLEELSLGFTDLTMSDINALFVPAPPPHHTSGVSSEELDWTPHTLHYLDLTGIPSVTQPALFSGSCVLLGTATAPLEVIELGDKIISSLQKLKNTNKRLGWVVKDLGRRGWYVREPTQDPSLRDNGKRWWKMGAMWWGMRKLPVAWGEIGGLYGHYMFKK
ncbi:hypothetical protein MMC16_004610 [Acarospora aff. strigata]|nr:hypothetical protein [Acarospora aff. strigata]